MKNGKSFLFITLVWICIAEISAMQKDETRILNTLVYSLNDISNDVIEHKILPHILNQGPWPRAEYGGRPLLYKNLDKEDDIKTIRAVAHVNKKLWKLINSEQVTGYFIKMLAQRYDLDQLVFAMDLRTKGAGQWMKQLELPTKKEDLIPHLNSAAESGRKGTVNFLLFHCPEMVDYPPIFHFFTQDNKTSALHNAARNGHDEIVDILIKAGANVNRPGYLKLTALHQAASSGHIKIVQRLLDASANDSLKCEYSRDTPFAEAYKSTYASHPDRKKFEEIVALMRSRMGWMRWMWSYITGK